MRKKKTTKQSPGTDNKKPIDAQELVQRYQAGDSTEELRTRFQISRSRIYQILKKAGIPKKRHAPDGHDQFLGVNLPERVKDALHAEANRRGISMSALASAALCEMLIARGYKLEATYDPAEKFCQPIEAITIERDGKVIFDGGKWIADAEPSVDRSPGSGVNPPTLDEVEAYADFGERDPEEWKKREDEALNRTPKLDALFETWKKRED